MWIRKKKGGGWKVWLVAGEVSELMGLPARLREALGTPDFSSKVVERLFPHAFTDDPEAEEEYQRLLRKDLLRQKLEGVEAFEKSFQSRKE